MSTPENEHNHQRFGPVPEQFLYNPGEDILLSTGAVTVLRTGGYLIIKDGLLSVSKLSAEFRRNDIKISDLFLSNYPGGDRSEIRHFIEVQLFQRADPIWEQPLTVESSRSYRSESGKQRPKLVCRSKECFPSFMYSQLD